MPIEPHDVGFTSPQAANASFTITIIMTATVTADTTIQLYCTNTGLVTASGGGAFPTSAVVLNGHSSVQVSLHTGSPLVSTNVTIAAGQPGADMSNSANWQASKVLNILAASPP